MNRKINITHLEELATSFSECRALLVCAQALAEADQPGSTLSLALLHILVDMNDNVQQLEETLEATRQRKEAEQ